MGAFVLSTSVDQFCDLPIRNSISISRLVLFARDSTLCFQHIGLSFNCQSWPSQEANSSEHSDGVIFKKDSDIDNKVIVDENGSSVVVTKDSVPADRELRLSHLDSFSGVSEESERRHCLQ